MLPLLANPRSVLTKLREQFFRSVFRARFRYDVFISYSHRDAQKYAVNLKNQLSSLDFSCFIDEEESPPGSSLDPTLAKALKKSAVLVLLATERALTRPYIVSEFEKFAATTRTIVPINILGALTRNEEEALTRSPWDIIKTRNLVWLDENDDSFSQANPSPSIADGIDKLFKYTRRNSRVRTEIISTAVLVLLLAVGAGFVIKGKAAEVSKQAGLAEAAKKDAEKQQGIATKAGKEAQRQLTLAEQATTKAEDQKKVAEKASEEASRQQEIARTATAEANKQLGIAQAAKAEANRQQEIAKAQLERNRHLLYDSNINLAQVAYEGDNLGRMSQLLDALQPVPPTPNQADLRGFDWFYLWRLSNNQQKVLTDYSEPMAFSPKTNTLAIGSGDKVLKLLDTLKKQSVITLPEFSGPIHSVMFSPSGEMLITGTEDGIVKLWDLSANPPQDLKTIRERTPKPKPGSHATPHFEEMPVKFSRDGAILATWSGDVVELWDTAGRKEQLTLNLNLPIDDGSLIKGSINFVDFSPNGKILVIVHSSHVEFWDLNTTKPTEMTMLRYEGNLSLGIHPIFAPDSKALVTEDRENSVKLWDLSTSIPREHAALEKARWHLFAVFSADGTRLILVDYNGTVEVWDASKAKPDSKIMTIDLGRDANTYPAVAFSPDDNTLAIWKGNGIIKVVSIKINEDAQLTGELATLRVPDGPDAAEFSADGQTFAALSHDGTMKAWGMGEPDDVGTLKAHASPVSAMKFSPDGKTLVALSPDKSLKFWDMNANRIGAINYQARFFVVCDALSPNGQTFALGGNPDGTVELLNTHPLKHSSLLKGLRKPMFALAFSPDGKTLVGGSLGKVDVWQTDKPDENPISLKVEMAMMKSVAFSPDGNTLAAADDHGTVALWDTNKLGTPRLLKTASSVAGMVFSGDGKTLVLKHQNGNLSRLDIQAPNKVKVLATDITNLALSLDRKTLVTLNATGELKLWDTNSLTEQRKLDLQMPDIGSLALSPDGRILATANPDAVQLRDIQTGQELITLRVSENWPKFPGSSVAFSVDGRMLIARKSSEVTSWYAATKDEVITTRER